MRMAYKEDWDRARERWKAYWDGEIVDRPVMLITVPADDPPPAPPPSPDPRVRWTDIDTQVREMELQNLRVRYLGEAVPPVHGPQAAWCAYYGGPVTFMPDTIWFEPFLESWDRTPDWERDWDDPGYRHLKAMMEAFCRARAGRYFVGFPPTMHTSPSDLLAGMRGTNRFLTDLVEFPDEVKAALAAMSRNFGRIFRELSAIPHAHGYEGYGNWWPIWCPDPLGVFQSDVCCMLSPAMVEEFVIPHLETTASFVTRSCYHLDGPGAIVHVDRICEVPGIHTIQWVPGAGAPPGALQWMDLFRRIQARGRSVYFGLRRPELETVIRELDPGRVILGMGAASVGEARSLVEDAGRWTARYWGSGHARRRRGP